MWSQPAKTSKQKTNNNTVVSYVRINLYAYLHVDFYPQGLVVWVERDNLALCSIQPLHHGGVQVLQMCAAVIQLSNFTEHFLLGSAEKPSKVHYCIVSFVFLLCFGFFDAFWLGATYILSSVGSVMLAVCLFKKRKAMFLNQFTVILWALLGHVSMFKIITVLKCNYWWVK